jgi:hypothetical protein
MNDQLVLLDDDETQRRYRQLDEHTRDIGRRGVALAREALRQGGVRGPNADSRRAA